MYPSDCKDYILSLIDEDIFIAPTLKQVIRRYILEKEPYGYPFFKNCTNTYKLFTTQPVEMIYPAAAGIEILILSLDITDDIQDQDATIGWHDNLGYALNGVLCLLLISNRLIRQVDSPYTDQSIELVEKQLFRSIEGQQIDLSTRTYSSDQYIDMVSKKSGSLAALSFGLAHVLATGKHCSNLLRLGEYIGIVQQLHNDLEGFITTASKNDVVNQKVTLPISYIFNKKDEASILLTEYYTKENPTSEDILCVKPHLPYEEAIWYTKSIKALYKNRAISLMKRSNFPPDFSGYLYASLL